MPWKQEIPTEPGHYWVLSATRVQMDLDTEHEDPTEPWMINVQRWGDCAPADQLKRIDDEDTLVIVQYYDNGVLHYNMLDFKGWFCLVERPPTLPDEVLEVFRANMD